MNAPQDAVSTLDAGLDPIGNRKAQRADVIGDDTESNVDLFLGSAGNLPVPLGYQPSGMGRGILRRTDARLPSGSRSRSARRVAERQRRVACATLSFRQRTVGIHCFDVRSPQPRPGFVFPY